MQPHLRCPVTAFYASEEQTEAQVQGVFLPVTGAPRSQVRSDLSIQAAQDRQARGVKRSADIILKDEEEQQYHEQQAKRQQQQAMSGLTESYTADGNDDGPLADEDDMEEEIVGELGQI